MKDINQKKEVFNEQIFEALTEIPELIKKLEEKERLNFLIKIMPFYIPKINPVKSQFKIENENIIEW